jgi:hypothetical protein
MSNSTKDDLRPEYKLHQLKGGVRGKYRKGYQESSNIVVIEPDLAEVFPNTKAVNSALRELLKLRKARTR